MKRETSLTFEDERVFLSAVGRSASTCLDHLVAAERANASRERRYRYRLAADAQSELTLNQTLIR